MNSFVDELLKIAAEAKPGYLKKQKGAFNAIWEGKDSKTEALKRFASHAGSGLVGAGALATLAALKGARPTRSDVLVGMTAGALAGVAGSEIRDREILKAKGIRRTGIGALSKHKFSPEAAKKYLD